MSEPYSVDFDGIRTHIYFRGDEVRDFSGEPCDDLLADIMNTAYAAGRRDAIAEMEARRDKREEL